MLVIAKDTEKTLLQELKTCWESFPTHRCLHLRFSQLEQDKEEWFADVLDSLRAFLEESTAQLYLCHDNDIFVLTRHLTNKRAAEFLAHLSHKLAPAPLTGLASLFEIGVDWPKLRDMCNKKLENIELLKNQKQQEKKDEVEKVTRDEALGKLDRDLISSLAMRREMREAPVIMVVEDDPFTQKLVGNTLKKSYEVAMTSDGQGALMNYVNKAPDVLFLDIGLPDFDGHTVLEKLFKIDPGAYVVMFSGNGDRENVMRAVELGAKGFVGKPFTQEKMFKYIEKSPFIQAKLKKEPTHGNHVR